MPARSKAVEIGSETEHRLPGEAPTSDARTVAYFPYPSGAVEPDLVAPTSRPGLSSSSPTPSKVARGVVPDSETPSRHRTGRVQVDGMPIAGPRSAGCSSCPPPELKHGESFEGIVTQSRELLQVLGTVEKIAESDNSVLIWGESGTGKELIAKAVHRISRRRDREYLAVNGAEFAADLFSSEFFGHEKGAFTGAVQDKRGLFEKADGGTLFIDEIGELSPPVQAKLLRALQSGEFFRLGSTEQRGADVRIIAATNKDLDLAVEEGTFRRDLYYRLNVNPVFVPPLRERRGDVPLLARHFLRMRAQKLGKAIHGISEGVMTFLSSYEFPGNVRELENLIAGAIVLEGSPVLTMASLPWNLLAAAKSRAVSARQSDGRTLAAVEAEHIRETLQRTGGNRTVAAQVLGVSRVGLLGKMKRYGLCGDSRARRVNANGAAKART
jgi:transcriptional regulator with PAS, ATPase and Fis domain